MSWDWRQSLPFHSRGFRFLSYYLRAQPVADALPVGVGGDGFLDFRAKRCVATAIGHWLLNEARGDAHQQAAFASLRQAFDHACAPDVRLHMYMLSDEAAMLYQAYEREATE